MIINVTGSCRHGIIGTITLAATPLFVCLACEGSVQAETAYFVVAEPEQTRVHGDSYILVLRNEADQAHARELIELGMDAGAPIVVAEIAAGSDGLNRDWLAEGMNRWPWHITSFSGFADNTIEILDGWPTFVGQDVMGWIENTNGFIGFWNYTVVAELDIDELCIPGDVNCDDRVDLADFNLLKGSFGMDGAWRTDGDLNDDERVDLADFNLLKANFGTNAAVPEPSTALLIVMGLIVGLVHLERRRR